jgi:hypothetical protein
MVLEIKPCVMLIPIANTGSRILLVLIQQNKKLLTLAQLALLLGNLEPAPVK